MSNSFKGFALVMCLMVGGCGQPQWSWWPWSGKEFQSLESVAHPDVLAAAGLSYYWRARVALAKGETIDRMYLLDENLYCLTGHNRLIALDAAKGTPKWSYKIASADQTVFRPTHFDKMLLSEKVAGIKEILTGSKPGAIEPFDAVLINTLSDIVVLDRTSGTLRRKIPLTFAANTAGATDGLYYFVGSTRGWYHAILLNEAVPSWTLSTEDLLSAPLEYYNGQVYVGGEDGVFYATLIGYQEGTRIWSQQLGGPITAGFHVDLRGCFVSCQDNRIYAFNARSGRQLWEPFVCNGALRDSVQVGTGTLFQYAAADQLYAINLANGKQRWAMPTGRKVLAAADRDVYILDDRGQLLVVDELTGRVSASLLLTGFDVFVSKATGDAIYAASSTGIISCIRSSSAGYLTAEMLR